MNQKISQRYQKALVTVAMGFRNEEDIKKNGLYRFTKQEDKELIDYICFLFNKNKSVLALQIKQTGYRSVHININSEEDLQNFINNLSDIYEEDNEIWVVSSSVLECWRCRIYLSNNEFNDTIEMAYSYDDHVLDHIGVGSEIPYIYFKRKENFYEVVNTNLDKNKIQEVNLIIHDIFSKYFRNFKAIKEDLDFLGIDGISLDVRINNGYDFHDFDVSYGNVERVINYYLPQLVNRGNRKAVQ